LCHDGYSCRLKSGKILLAPCYRDKAG
jgi:hypothetical protein